MKKYQLLCTLFFISLCLSALGGNIVTTDCSSGFPLSVAGITTNVYYDSKEPEVVKTAANLFCSDIEQVTTRKPNLSTDTNGLSDYAVIIGSIGNSSLIDQLISSGKIKVDAIKNKWECFSIQTVESPMTGVKKALVIVGSDRRGTAYGVFEVSKGIGVSPLYFWADVVPTQKEALYICPINYSSNEPSVKYRGIFINDEDWGLQLWAKNTFDPAGDIAPTTYAKVFELLLRMKANYCWPAMHACTKPFNYFADNKVVADKYGIIMGSSHHEPLLYNSTSDWPYASSLWNPYTNLDNIMAELEKRVISNGSYENVYTLGIRGAGDGSLSGTLNEQTAIVQTVMGKERDLLAKYVNADLSKVPQVFWPYKEVLNQYNNGLIVPDEVTLGWVDDNFGYIRQLSNPTEQKRSGGSGVYYHLSYYGSPEDYLWLGTMQPALIAKEMKKAADYGANRVWVFNVGDIKPQEILMNYCLDLAYDYTTWTPNNVRQYLLEFSTTQFGKQYAESIANILMKFYQLSHAAKPEHMDNANLKFSDSELEERLTAFKTLTDNIETLYAQMPSQLKDAFFQLVYYPVVCTSLQNQKFTYARKSFQLATQKNATALDFSQKALVAYNTIQDLTSNYNTGIQNGKWNKIISSHPRSQAAFNVPMVATQANIEAGYTEYTQIDLSKGTFVAPMKYLNGVVYGDKVGVQTAATGGSAIFTFNLENAVTADVYFLIKTPTDTQDSWFITINGTQFTQNNTVTGEIFEWVNVKNMALIAGTNTLIINQREPNAQIAGIKITATGLFPYSDNFIPNPNVVVPAWKFSIKQNVGVFSWNTVEGLSTSEKGLTNLPDFASSVSTVSQAPYIEQNIRLTQLGNFNLQVRCMPTQGLYVGRDLRFGVSINEDTPQIYTINCSTDNLEWPKNVVRGYSVKTLSSTSSSPTVKVRLYALDPAVIFDKVLIYSTDKATNENSVAPLLEEATDDSTTGENSGLGVKNNNLEKTIKIYPNPFSIKLSFSIENHQKEVINLGLYDLMGRALIQKEIYIKQNYQTIDLPVSYLPNGNYILSIKTKNGQSYSRIVSKQ